MKLAEIACPATVPGSAALQMAIVSVHQPQAIRLAERIVRQGEKALGDRHITEIRLPIAGAVVVAGEPVTVTYESGRERLIYPR